MMQRSENSSVTPFVKTGCPGESAEKLHSGTSDDTNEQSALNRNLERNSGISEELSSDAEAVADQEPIGNVAEHSVAQTDVSAIEAAQRRRGAPAGNMNAFKSGADWIRQAKQGLRSVPDSRLLGRRFARELTSDLGGKDTLTAAKREIIDHLRRDKETLEDLYACRDEILELKPTIRRNIAALAKIDSYIAPVMQRIVVNLLRLGLERQARTIDLAPWEQLSEAKITESK